MPLNMTRNAQKQFMQLGTIRKGEMQPAKGNPNVMKPVDLDYFRITYKFNGAGPTPMNKAEANDLVVSQAKINKEIEETIKRVYGPKPTTLNFRLAYNTVDESWDANYECYKKGGLIAKAGERDTGPYWIFYRDPKDSEVLVRDGQPVGDRGREFMAKPIDVAAPVYYTESDKKPVFMQPVGRLQMVIPEVAHLAVGYFLFQPGSPRDIRNISAELGAYDAVAKSIGKSITGMPFKLIRREEEVTKNIDGKLSKGKSWVVHVEVGGDWGKLAIGAIERLALPDVIEGEISEAAYDDVTEDGPGPMVNEALRLASKNAPVPVATPKMTYDEAKQVIVKQAGGVEKFMSELGKKQLNWLILNSQDPKQVEAAEVVLLGKE